MGKNLLVDRVAGNFKSDPTQRMAHFQQSGSETRPNKSYRQRPPEDASQPYDPTSHNNFVGDQGFNFNESPPYESTQKYSDNRYGPQEGDSRQYGDRGRYGRGGHHGGRGHSGDRAYDGRSERNEGRGQDIYRGQDGTRAHNGGDMRRPPEQQRTIGPERRAYTDPRAWGPARLNHAPSKNDFVAPQHAQYQDQDQSQQSRHRGMPQEPVFEEGPAEISSSNYDRTEGYHESRNYHPLPQRYPDNNNNTASANLNERFVLNNQQQDYGEAYRHEISQGGSGYTPDYPYNDNSRSQFGNGQSKMRADELQNTQFPKPRQSSTIIANSECSK